MLDPCRHNRRDDLRLEIGSVTLGGSSKSTTIDVGNERMVHGIDVLYVDMDICNIEYDDSCRGREREF
jgi:hypothetical protein